MFKGKKVVIIGGGFTGLAAAYEITREGITVTVLEKDNEIGGLAGSFEINGQHIEKFYHHCFNSDKYILQLTKELGCEKQLLCSPTRTGIYIDNKIFKLSTPLDVLRFNRLSPLNRIRLGLLVLKAHRVKDWRQLESLTAEEWLVRLCGREVYQTVWEPLLRGKFGPFASEVSAVWFWNKLVLRGGSRGKGGEEVLAYYRGGFAAFAEAIANEIASRGGVIQTGVNADALVIQNGHIKEIQTSNGAVSADAVILTPPLPIIGDLLGPYVSSQFLDGLRSVKYLSNLCLVLDLSRSLTEFYWLNVNDPEFPFVGVIEHTNFQPPEAYGGRHIVYLSKYLSKNAELYHRSDEQIFEFSIPHIRRLFPKFDRAWVQHYHVWKADYAQPIVQCNYNQLIPSNETPINGVYIATMAQVYPEDRGINYAVRQGRQIGRLVAKKMAH